MTRVQRSDGRSRAASCICPNTSGPHIMRCPLWKEPKPRGPRPCGCWTSHVTTCSEFQPGLQSERIRAAKEGRWL